MEWIALVITAVMTAFNVWRDWNSRKNQKRLTDLESDKLDLETYKFGWEIMLGLVGTLRQQIADCDKDRDEMREQLIAKGLLHPAGERGDSNA